MYTEVDTDNLCERALGKLIRYCRAQGWAGYDPYDGLNAFGAGALSAGSKLGRTVLIQMIKRSPVNLRPILGIRKELNPKGVALSSRAVLRLLRHYGRTPGSNHSNEIAAHLQDDLKFLINSLDRLRSADYEEACWGYNFDWQSRAFFAPRGTPNVVCTVFAAKAYLDWFEMSGNPEALEVAESSCRFILDRLNRAMDADAHCFSYTPLDRSRVHNVNLLAAELLARVASRNGKEEYRDAARRAVSYTLARQASDGSWPYGEDRNQTWIDGFHTGFVLVSLRHIIEYLGESRWRENLERGYKFYRDSFFLADYTPKYYHDKLYPIDAHSAAQSIITFVEMIDLMPQTEEFAGQALRWAIANLQDEAGFFYFQRHRFYTIRVPYMRWAQAWMLYALSLYLSRGSINTDV